MIERITLQVVDDTRGVGRVEIDGDYATVRQIAVEVSGRMAAQDIAVLVAEKERALSTTDLDRLVAQHGSLTAVRDRDGNVWRWQRTQSWNCREYDTYLHVDTHALHRDFSPLTTEA